MIHAKVLFTAVGHINLSAWACREKLTATDAKLRAALQDKNSAQMEKAAAERALKMAQGQAGRLTKDLEKKACRYNLVSCVENRLTVHLHCNVRLVLLGST